jgi:hypothetical protein
MESGDIIKTRACKCGIAGVTFRYGEPRAWVCPKCNPEVGNGICRAGCDTQDHESYWECLQAANVSIDKTSLRP